MTKQLLQFLDTNACLRNPCDTNAECTDTGGSYECECKSGYTGDGWNCTGMDNSEHLLNSF